MAYSGVTPPRDWTARLRATTEIPAGADLHPIERDALDNAVPFAAEHARRYIATGGEDDGWDGPRPILLLYTTGRRSGATRRNPFLYLEHDGELFVIGSKGGDAAHPLWFRNLLDSPQVHVRVDHDFYAATAEVLSTQERAAIWPILTARYEMFAGYQARTEREIPVVRLLDTRHGAANG